jgi:hypothetical protein
MNYLENDNNDQLVEADDMEAEATNSAAQGDVESGFPHIEKLFEETGHGAFDDPNYYTTALSDAGELSQRLHGIFRKYATATDLKDKAIFRQQLVNIFWEFSGKTALLAAGNLPDPKKYLLRFGILHPNLLNAEAKEFFSKLPVTNNLGQTVYYLDEWMNLIGSGKIKCSATDEINVGGGNSNTGAHLLSLREKAEGKVEGSRGLLRVKNKERVDIEGKLSEAFAKLIVHSSYSVFPEIFDKYTEDQKHIFNEIHDCLKTLTKIDREISIYMKDLEQGIEDMETINEKMREVGVKEVAAANLEAIKTEFGSIRQMAKMTVGRQGNAFPIMSSEFFHVSTNGVGFKENVIKQLAWIESIDAEAFIRFYKGKPNRIVPYVILLPTYGDFGMCWEPFDKSNRATSRGRIAIPMYPKNLLIAILAAVGDMRWQVAKEKASYYWMEEGLTGNYYQWFQAQKLKGDVRMYFIQDYIFWMTKESEGTQKLDKDVRGTFWRYMPFTQPVKDKLKDRNLIYQELYQRDKNRAMSDMF